MDRRSSTERDGAVEYCLMVLNTNAFLYID